MLGVRAMPLPFLRADSQDRMDQEARMPDQDAGKD